MKLSILLKYRIRPVSIVGITVMHVQMIKYVLHVQIIILILALIPVRVNVLYITFKTM